MQEKDWWYLIATIASPFLAAGLTAFITLAWQSRKEKRDLKFKVFTSIMGARGNIDNFQVAQEWARSMNLIDVAFSDSPKVLKLWHELYEMLQHKEAAPGQVHKNIELIWAMSKELGMNNLNQTDIDKAHFPRAIADPIKKANEIQSEFLRVLQNTASIKTEPVPQPPPAGNNPQPRSIAQTQKGR